MPTDKNLDGIREKIGAESQVIRQEIKTDLQALREELKTELQVTRKEFKVEMELAIAQVTDAITKVVVNLASGEDLQRLATSVGRLRDVVTAGRRRRIQRPEADTPAGKRLADLEKRVARLERKVARAQA